MNRPAIQWHRLISRWALGMALVSWRYLWQTTPLHRSEHPDEQPHLPPALPQGFDDGDLLPVEAGVGPLFHRRFKVHIVEGTMDAQALMSRIIERFASFVPREVVQVSGLADGRSRLEANDTFVVDMPGPWNGPVRVASVGSDRLHLATLRGHLEAGQIEFRARDVEGGVVFEIEAWARPSGTTVRLLYAGLRLAKEIQLNMWVRFCKAAVSMAEGRMDRGIEIVTYRCPFPEDARGR